MSPLDTPIGLLGALRAAVVERLAAAEAFADPNAVPVIDGGRADIAKSVGNALQMRTAGLCIVVTVPRMDPGNESQQHVQATLALMIYERPATNWSEKGRQLSVEDAAEASLIALGWTGEAPGWAPSAAWTRFVFGGFRLAFASTDTVAMEVTFTTETHLQVSPSET